MGVGDFLMAAAGGGPPAGATITSTSFTVTIGGTCPDPDNVSIDYTASGVEAGDEVRIKRLVDGELDKTVHEGDLASSETINDTYGRKFGSTSVTLEYRVEAIRSNQVTSQLSSSQSVKIDETFPCAE